MLTATFQKKWCYGTPTLVDINVDFWFEWIKFINIMTVDDILGIQIFTDWGEDRALYGYSQLVVDEDGHPADPSKSIVFVKGVQEAFMSASSEDWRIENHKELIPIVRRVMGWIGAREDEWKDKAMKIKTILNT